jgi:undecaprenyl-diphosphatase
MIKKNRTLIPTIISSLIFIFLTCLMEQNKLLWLDNFVSNDMTLHINFYNSIIMRIITSFGNATILILVTIIFLLFTYKRKDYQLYGQTLLFILVSSELLNIILKDIFHRVRPHILRLMTETSYSFPSGHAMVSICFYGYIIYLVSKFVKSEWKYIINLLLIILILSIGVSRIYLGVHYTSDVIGGYSFGLAWLLLVICAMEKINNVKMYR